MKKFDPQIYPRKLYIVESYDEIMELFTNRDEDATSPPDTDGYGAITFPVIEKSTGHYGVAVYFVEDITIGRIAHEADRVVSSMWQDLGVVEGRAPRLYARLGSQVHRRGSGFEDC